MSNIIFQNVIDTFVSSSHNINDYLENFDSYNTDFYKIAVKIPQYNFIIYILIILIVFHFITKFEIKLSQLFALFISMILIFFLIRNNYDQFIKYTTDKKIQLDFLHKLMFDSKNVEYARTQDIFIKPVGQNEKSYLYMNGALVQFFFNNRQYSQYNIIAYTNSLVHCNNVIALDYQSKIGLNRSYLNYELAVEESKKALNEFNSIVYALPHTFTGFDIFDKGVKILNGLLNKHLEDMELIFKNENKLHDLTINSKPDNFFDNYHNVSSNDINTKNYISIFNQY